MAKYFIYGKRKNGQNGEWLILETKNDKYYPEDFDSEEEAAEYLDENRSNISNKISEAKIGTASDIVNMLKRDLEVYGEAGIKDTIVTNIAAALSRAMKYDEELASLIVGKKFLLKKDGKTGYITGKDNKLFYVNPEGKAQNLFESYEYLKEALGQDKYYTVKKLIKECVANGLEVEITIPKNKVLDEGLFGNSIKDLKGKQAIVSIYGPSDYIKKLYQRTQGAGMFKFDGIEGGRELVFKPVKNDKETVRSLILNFKKTIVALQDAGEVTVPKNTTLEICVHSEKQGGDLDIAEIDCDNLFKINYLSRLK